MRRVAVAELDAQGALEMLNLVLGHHGLAPAAPEPVALKLADLPDDTPAAPELLHSVGECSNVNAIAGGGEPLTFAPQHITLVYGGNGVGKSSYARIIKRIARAAHEERILPNVFAGVSSPPRAVADIESAHGRTKHIVPLTETGVPLLQSMTVFDSLCATVYLRREKTLEFTPTPLRIFARAASAQRRIRELLDERIAALESQQFELERFPAPTRVRIELDTIAQGPRDLKRLEALAELTAEEHARRTEAELELAAVNADTVEERARRRERDANQLEELATAITAIDAGLSPAVERAVTAAREALRQATEAVELARSVSLAGETLPAGGDAWLRMWEAARAYVEQECEHEFPPSGGGRCPLCQQELSEEAQSRLDRFEQHVRSTVERQCVDAHVALELELKKVATIDRDALLTMPGVAILRDEAPADADALQAWLVEAANRESAIRQGRQASTLATAPAVATLRDRAAGRRNAASRQRSLTVPEKLAELRTEVDDLKSRALLADVLPEVREWRKRLLTVAVLRNIRKELDTGALSTKQTELAAELVTAELRDRLRAELDALGFGHLELDLTTRSERGATVAKMAFESTSAAVGDVLSDGEQRGCALAFFLAESLASPSTGGVVFDDPATSFDIERVDHIARRIAELAQRRSQVIVFTHDLVFAWCLQTEAERLGIGFSVRPIARLGSKVGIVRPDQAWPGERLRDRVRRLRNTLESLEAQSRKGDIGSYEAAAKMFASDIREAWERVIEELLFHGVVMRFQRDVKALQIRDVEVTREMTQEVFDGMTETSAFHHQAALAKPVPTPSVDDLKRFFGRLERFCESQSSSKKTSARSNPAAGPAA